MARIALTTIDNPYDPFEEFTPWLLFDKEKGYDCCELLARFARTSDQLTDEENDEEIERAIDEIIKYDVENVYTKIKRPDSDFSTHQQSKDNENKEANKAKEEK